MSSISSSIAATGAPATNAALTNLLQTLKTIDPTDLANPAVAAALQKAAPSDIVKLSDAALQLQSVDALFGSTASSTDSSSDPFASLLDSGSSITAAGVASDPLATLLSNPGYTSGGSLASTNAPTGSTVKAVG